MLVNSGYLASVLIICANGSKTSPLLKLMASALKARFTSIPLFASSSLTFYPIKPITLWSINVFKFPWPMSKTSKTNLSIPSHKEAFI